MKLQNIISFFKRACLRDLGGVMRLNIADSREISISHAKSM